MTESTQPYPASLSIDYPDRQLNRLTTFFRIIMVIPIAIVLGLVSHGAGSAAGGGNRWAAAGGTIFLALVLMLLFKQKYPRWWFDWNLALTRFGYRVAAYLSLLRDEYPSTDEEQAVHLDLVYPDARNDLNRALPLVKWLLAVPHFIMLALLGIAAFFGIVFAWFAILFSGRYPRGIFDFVVGVLRWGLRVSAYALLLTTDRYPPFSLQ
jgi:hypothetical protein